MTDMMIQDPTDELDELRDLGESDTVEETVDDLRDMGNDDSEQESLARVAVSSEASDIQEDDEADEEVSEADDSEEESEEESVADEAPVVEKVVEEKTPVVAVEAKPAPVAPKAEPVADKPVVAASVKSDPAPQVKAETSSPARDDDDYNPSLALKSFMIVRRVFITIFDIILTGIAIVVEAVAGLDWGGYRDAIFGLIAAANDMMKARVPRKNHIAVYALIAIILIGIPTSLGAFAIFSGADNVSTVQNTQTVNISQQSGAIADNGILAPLFTPTVQVWAEDIARWTNNSNVTPNMLAIVMQLESCGNSTVEGGLFGIGMNNGSLVDTETHALAAVERLESALNTSNGDFAMALAVYADGESVMQTDFGAWSFHARDMFILGRNIYNQAKSGYINSPDLNSWLQNTGSILCTEAQTTLNN